MPVIRKIEIANFLNIERGAAGNKWLPMWPHQVFDLDGVNSALNIPNGHGKSAMAKAILAMLVGDRKTLREVTNYSFAPKQNNHYSHVRIEVLVAGGQDLYSRNDGAAGGEPMVFGMYGNGGENGEVRLYSYQGTLDDCPVAHAAGINHTSVDDATFLAALDDGSKKPFPKNRQERTDDAWRNHVQTLFDVSSLQQQFKYQQANAAEGSKGYFDVKEWPGQDYSASVLYERLAPELLGNVMGDLGNEGEDSIIETIRIKTTDLIKQRHNSAEAAKRLVLSENTVEELGRLVALHGELAAAKAGYDGFRKLFSVEYETLKYLVLDRPIPGIPVPPAETMPIGRSMVLQGGKWFIPDRVMAEFTGEPASDVNRRAQERNALSLEKLEKLQIIDFACHNETRKQKGGPAGNLYSRENALALLNLTTNFTKAWSKQAAIEAVTQAFDWVEAHSDTNPARVMGKKLQASIHAAEKAADDLQKEFDDHTRQLTELSTQQTKIGASQSAYRLMSDSHLFTEEELKNPEETGKRVVKAAEIAAKAAEMHKQRMMRLEERHCELGAFRRQHPDIEPGVLADTLQTAKSAAMQALETAKRLVQEARGKRPDAQKNLDAAKAALQKAESRFQNFHKTAPATARFAEIFGEESPVGMVARLQGEFNAKMNRKGQINTERGTISPYLEALKTFRSNNHIEPSEWLESCQSNWERHVEQIKALEAVLTESKTRRAGLDKEAVVAGKVAREAAIVAGGDHISLHSAINSMGLGQTEKSRALTLFSALLHSPVYKTTQEAKEAAERLESAQIEAPVFLHAELESFCRDGMITVEGVLAHTWLVGIRTRQVECLLDPSMVEREKKALDEEIHRQDKEITGLKQAPPPHPNGDDAKIARAADTAVTEGYETLDAGLSHDLSEIEAALSILEEKTSQEVIKVILATERHQKEFSDVTEPVLQEQLVSCKETLSAESEKLFEIESKIQECEHDLDKKQAAVNEANAAALQAGKLRDLQAYIDHPEDNPAFMELAPGELARLELERARADKKTHFEFDVAEVFVKNDGSRRALQIEAELRERQAAREDILNKRLPELHDAIKQLRENALLLRSGEEKIDWLARELTKAYRNYALFDDFVPVGLDDVLKTSLGSQTIGIHEAQDDGDRCDMLIQMADEFEAESQVKNDMDKAKGIYASVRKEFDYGITLVLKTSDLDMSDHVRMELERARSEPDLVVKLYADIKHNHDRAKAANRIATEHLEKEWQDIGEWLTNFTKNLKTNFTLMKTVFSPEIDKETGRILKPGFLIEGSVAEGEDTKAIMDEVVATIEAQQKKEIIEREAGTLTRSEESKNRVKLDQQIKEKFFPRVITGAGIKLCMPSIAKHPLKLKEKMVSTGQGIAMALMWIVRMAEFSTKRWQNEQTSSQAQRKRVTHTQFTIIDGAFSSLSDERLIMDALDTIDATKGNFQLIITNHDPDYRNNFDYFPTLIVAKELNNRFMKADKVSRERIESKQGAIGVMSMRLVAKNGVALPRV